jgi:hypothetical protein
MTYGTYKRAFPRIIVLRNNWGNETSGISTTAVPKTDEAIKSGMVISQDTNGEWVKGAAAGKCPYFAVQDQSDTDVLSCGKLTGLSCAGDYEIQTGYFDTNDTFVVNSPLVAGTSGLAGYVDLGGSMLAAVTLIGFVIDPGEVDLGETCTSATATSVLTLKTMWRPASA